MTIPAGQKVAMLGRVGSGKSTMLRLMAGLYAPLTAPASETLLKSPSPLPAPAEATVVHANDWSAWWAVLMVIGVGIGAGYAFAIYSPYRLYWPW